MTIIYVTKLINMQSIYYVVFVSRYTEYIIVINGTTYYYDYYIYK